MFTREELEAIWRNEPYGYFHKLLKLMKNKKKYTVECKLFKRELVDTIEENVYAASAEDAVRQVSLTLPDKIRRKNSVISWQSEYSTQLKVV